MGNTGSRLKKLRKSLRRISLSRSREHLDRGDQARRSKSLINLSAHTRNDMQKKKSRSEAVLTSESYPDEFQDQEESKKDVNEKTPPINKLDTPTSDASEVQKGENEKMPQINKLDTPTSDASEVQKGENEKMPQINKLDTPTSDASEVQKDENEKMPTINKLDTPTSDVSEVQKGENEKMPQINKLDTPTSNDTNNRIRTKDELDTWEKYKLRSGKIDAKSLTRKIIADMKKINLNTKDDEILSEKYSINVSGNYSALSPLEKKSDVGENPNKNDTKSITQSIDERNDCSGVIALKNIDKTLHDMEQQIEEMPREDLLVYLPTFKDEIHILWKKSYDVKASSTEVNPKKADTIEYIKRILNKLYSKAFKQHNYHITETNM